MENRIKLFHSKFSSHHLWANPEFFIKWLSAIVPNSASNKVYNLDLSTGFRISISDTEIYSNSCETNMLVSWLKGAKLNYAHPFSNPNFHKIEAFIGLDSNIIIMGKHKSVKCTKICTYFAKRI